MAKRKKHHKKKKAQARQQQQTMVQASSQSTTAHEPVVVASPKAVEIAEAGSVKEAQTVSKDVLFSLALIGIIIAVYLVLYFLLQNSTVSASVYGLIKLPNLGN